MSSCFIALCKNKSGTKTPGVHYFRMTKSRYLSWMKAIGRDPNEKLSSHNCICSEHFLEEDIILLPSGNRILKKGAVPKLNLKNVCQSLEETVAIIEPVKMLPSMTDFYAQAIPGTSHSHTEGKMEPIENLTVEESLILSESAVFELTIGDSVEETKADSRTDRSMQTFASFPMNNADEYVEVDINQVCRFCLGQTEVSPFFRLITKHNLQNRNITFVEMMENHVQFKISEADNKPQNVCNPCISQLCNAYHFFEMCALSNKILDETLRHNKNTKELETVDLTDDTEKENSFVKDEKLNEFEQEIDQRNDLFSNKDEEEISIKIENNEVPPTSSEANNIINNIKSLISKEHNYGLGYNTSKRVKTKKVKLEKKSKTLNNTKTKLEEKPKQRKTTSRKNFKTSERVKVSQFHCRICKEMLSTFKDVIDHFDKIHEGCTQCILCDNLVSDKPTKLLKYHMNTHRRKDTRFDCRKCFQYFLTRTELEEHFKSEEHNSDPRVCKICSRPFNKKELLQAHMMSHTNEKKYQCSKCGKCFKYSGGLSKHFKVKHKGFRMLCNICGKVFTTKLGLDNHIQIVHEGSKSYNYFYKLEWKRRRRELAGNQLVGNRKQRSKDRVVEDPSLKKCRFCEDEFKSVSGRKHHETIKHGYEIRVKCNRCPQVFSSTYERLAHIKSVHHKHECSYCGQGFSLEWVFKRHLALHEKPGYTKCLQCNRECKTPSNLKCHMTTHTGDRPYKCDKCDKAFRQGAHLRYHQFQHTRKKPFECHLCRKTFGQESYLQSHLNVHKGKRPFACDLCDKAYAEKTTLRKHIKKIHGVHDVETLQKSEGSAEKEHEGTIANPKPSVIVIENSHYSLDIETLQPL